MCCAERQEEEEKEEMTKGLERADTLPNFLLQQTNLYSQKQIDFWRIDPPTTNQPLVYVQYVQFVQFY